jgi:hypothetical protein
MRTNTSNKQRRGRVLRTREQRQELIRRYRASGWGKAEYCRQQEVKLATFCHWMKGQPMTKQRRSVSSTKSKVKFAEVQVALGATAPVEIALASGIRLRDLSRWKELVEFLRELTRC